VMFVFEGCPAGWWFVGGWGWLFCVVGWGAVVLVYFSFVVVVLCVGGCGGLW
jgi:hypothetical protein